MHRVQGPLTFHCITVETVAASMRSVARAPLWLMLSWEACMHSRPGHLERECVSSVRGNGTHTALVHTRHWYTQGSGAHKGMVHTAMVHTVMVHTSLTMKLIKRVYGSCTNILCGMIEDNVHANILFENY